MTTTYEVYYDDSVIELPSRRLICHPHKLADALMIVDALNRAGEMRSATALLAANERAERYEKALKLIAHNFEGSADTFTDAVRIARTALRASAPGEGR